MKRSLFPHQALIGWYEIHRRPMPWRRAPTPYGCWLSEIMLQQTTYEQALPYYERFLRRFPTVRDLAKASEQEVLKAWEGLGYYARARHLAAAAKAVDAAGWPVTYEGWLALPGVGPYTAAALSSVLNGVAEPVVDGNVARVFARYWHLSADFRQAKARMKLADRLRGAIRICGNPGAFNQAMMELGALVCTPSNPACGDCPLAASCAARKARDAEAYPKRAKRGPVPVRTRTFVVIRDASGRVLLVRNEAGALLKGLWELPSVEAAPAYRQTFSHFKLEASVFTRPAGPEPVFRDPATVPLTTAAKRILAYAGAKNERISPSSGKNVSMRARTRP